MPLFFLCKGHAYLGHLGSSVSFCSCGQGRGEAQGQVKHISCYTGKTAVYRVLTQKHTNQALF